MIHALRMQDNMTLWVCRAGRFGEHENHFLDKSLIAITWSGLHTDLTKYSDEEDFKNVLRETYPEDSKGQISNYYGQLYPFVF
ncbi:MAG: hypothetical protein J5897_05775, partial [Candidatus Methanomethylophilus sp.]|nr:hypothetical protein [Methanomethylophilus sp.]